MVGRLPVQETLTTAGAQAAGNLTRCAWKSKGPPFA
jgi:hypothetical protein